MSRLKKKLAMCELQTRAAVMVRQLALLTTHLEVRLSFYPCIPPPQL